MSAPRITVNCGNLFEMERLRRGESFIPEHVRNELLNQIERETFRGRGATQPPATHPVRFIAALLKTDYVRANRTTGTCEWLLDLRQLVTLYDRYLRGAEGKGRLTLKYVCEQFTYNGEPVKYGSVRTERNRDAAPALPDDLAETMERYGYKFKPPRQV